MTRRGVQFYKRQMTILKLHAFDEDVSRMRYWRSQIVYISAAVFSGVLGNDDDMNGSSRHSTAQQYV